MNPLGLNLAYQFVATSLMLLQVNSTSKEWNLPVDHTITQSDVRSGSHVGPANSKNFSGSILTDQYFFGFVMGHLANFYNRGTTPNSDREVRKRNFDLAKLPSLIDANEAYQLATNYVVKAGLNLPMLEEKYRLNIVQWRYYPNNQTSDGLQTPSKKAVMLPVYQVEWRGSLFRGNRALPDRPVVSITISGSKKELWEYHVLDDSLFLTSPIQIDEPETLLAIEDGEFQKYSVLQQRNLVARFASGVTNQSSNPSKVPSQESKAGGK